MEEMMTLTKDRLQELIFTSRKDTMYDCAGCSNFFEEENVAVTKAYLPGDTEPDFYVMCRPCEEKYGVNKKSK